MSFTRFPLPVVWWMTLLLGGCTMAPEYQRPEAGSFLAPAWPQSELPQSEKLPKAQPAAAADSLGWRQFYTDPRLQKLIERAFVNNPDLKIATLNVQKARAQYQITDSILFPTIKGTADVNIQRTAKTLSNTGQPVNSHSYSLGLGFTSYEIDLFGRLQSLKNQALDQYLALQETQLAARITLVSEVASDWLTWLANRDLLRLNTETLESQLVTVNALRQSRAQGVTTELTLRDAETQLHSAEADVAQAVRDTALARDALEQVLGEPITPEIEAYLAQSGGLTDPVTSRSLLIDLPAGLPSDLLTRRPDIRSAEETLRANNAYIGAARAAFFPSITLTSSIGTASSGLSGLFAKGSDIWQFAPQISLPIFDGGVNYANLKVAKINRELALTQYQQTIQNAFRETADALASRATYETQILAVEQQVKDATASYRLSKMRSDAGVDTLLNTLIRQRTQITAQQSAINLRLARLNNLVTLYRVLGGGWQEGEIKPTEMTPANPVALPRK